MPAFRASGRWGHAATVIPIRGQRRGPARGHCRRGYAWRKPSKTEDLTQGSTEPCKAVVPSRVAAKTQVLRPGSVISAHSSCDQRGVPGDGPRPREERPGRGRRSGWQGGKHRIQHRRSSASGARSIHSCLHPGPRPRGSMRCRETTPVSLGRARPATRAQKEGRSRIERPTCPRWPHADHYFSPPSCPAISTRVPPCKSARFNESWRANLRNSNLGLHQGGTQSDVERRREERQSEHLP